MEPLADFNSSTMCGLHDQITQERMNIPTQLPLEALIYRIGVAIISVVGSVIGLRTYLDSTLPDYSL